MKQPILFQSRAVCLTELMDELNVGVLEEMDASLVATDAQYLHHYLTLASAKDALDLSRHFYRKYGIRLLHSDYVQLDVPYAVDLATGQTYEVVSINYHADEVSSVVVWGLNSKMQFIYNKDSTYIPSNAYATNIKILHDGWF